MNAEDAARECPAFALLQQQRWSDHDKLHQQERKDFDRLRDEFDELRRQMTVDRANFINRETYAITHEKLVEKVEGVSRYVWTAVGAGTIGGSVIGFLIHLWIGKS